MARIIKHCQLCGRPREKNPERYSYYVETPLCDCDERHPADKLERVRSTIDALPDGGRVVQIRALKAHLGAVYAERDRLLKELGRPVPPSPIEEMRQRRAKS